MNPSKSGWLKEYLDFRKDLLGDYQQDKRKSAHPEFALYKIIQPTGIMYGQSISVLEHPDAEKWSEKDKLKILLAESLIGSSILFYDKPINTEIDIKFIIQQTVESISNFYNHVFPELATASRNWLGQKKSAMEMAEQIIEKRIERSTAHANNFWTNFFHNSLLFIDIYIFGQWIHTQGNQMVSDFFKYQREELRFSVVKIITSAAHANNSVEFEERKLMEYFLQSAGLTSEKKKEAKEIFEQGIQIEELDLPTNNSWILRKYFLEMAILTIWADKQVEEAEMQFLRRLAKHLNFSDDDTENSLIALEGFILQHWEELKDLQNKRAFQQVSDQFIKRLSKVAQAHEGRLLKETKANSEMMALILKAKATELTPLEKIRMSELILSVLKTIPNFTVVSLPQKFLTLSVLMKILPPDFFAEVLN